MEAAESPDVLEEVEALFKKLQHLPESIRKKALSCIQQKLPDTAASNDEPAGLSQKRPGLRRGGSPRKISVSLESVGLAKGSPRKINTTEDDPLNNQSEADDQINDADEVEASPSEQESTFESPSKGEEQIEITPGQSGVKGKLPFRLRVKKEKEIQSSSHDDMKVPAIDEGTPVVLMEDIRTLHGRKTKRINVANLIRGVRKPRAQPASPTKPSTKAKDIVIERVTPRVLRQSAAVSSDIADVESAEILASLSKVSQKDLNQGITLNVNLDQSDCLKDKTNNQESEGVEIAVAEDESSMITVKIESSETIVEDQTAEAGDEEGTVIVGDPYIPAEDDDENEEDEDDPVEEENEYGCHFCDFKSKTKYALSVHVKKHKENIPKNSSKTVYACSECNKTFSQSCGLQLHMKRHRNERDFACPHCEYKAYTKVDLSRHQTIHTGERNKICEFCGKAFAKDSTLRDHVKAIHERKTKHECEVCGFVTHRANNLRVHIRMRHHGEYNNHVCPVCGASVKQKNAFLEHMRSHTGERPYKCDECSASFACLARLNVHRNAVHGERLFKCGDCDKSFQTKHHLLRHHAIHTKERPYACPFCSYACNTQGNIAKHVRSIHNCPDFSYRKYKLMQENGGQPSQVDPEWVRKGEEVTKEYLNNLSEKMGRPITLDELWDKEKELQKKKEDQEKARLALKEQRAAKSEAAGAAFLSKAKKRRGDASRRGKHGSQDGSQEDADDPSTILISDIDADGEGTRTEFPFYQLVSQAGNIQLCLETDEVQVYTGDATRELSILQPKEGDDDETETMAGEEIQTIQGYMNENGEFVRLDEGAMVTEDSSTVVVIIDSELNEGLTPEVADVMEVSCNEQNKQIESNKRSIECDVPMDRDSKRKKSVIRIIKQEIAD
ncbi:zinc finger and SCAN domain-containing protein 20-like [Thrips palmi]|uniref:Zinc finger and SCAN domain-containing protein 20-like n=1 Tax=Thrips palmi TaxID=161013 RepID=A0A6P8ZLQ8_THRPL|nr:zinc finger and SCAN domain-containing protein 20-like [Thrips palmi]